MMTKNTTKKMIDSGNNCVNIPISIFSHFQNFILKIVKDFETGSIIF